MQEPGISLASLPKLLWKNAQAFFELNPDEHRYTVFYHGLLSEQMKYHLRCVFDSSPPHSKYCVRQTFTVSSAQNSKIFPKISVGTTEIWSLSDSSVTNATFELSYRDLEQYVHETSDRNQSLGKAEQLMYDQILQSMTTTCRESLQTLVVKATEKALEALRRRYPLRRIEGVKFSFSENATSHTFPSGRRKIILVMPDWHIGRSYVKAPGPTHRAMIAVGSNVGDRVGVIEKAFEEMSRRILTLKSISPLYETAPMYVTDQPAFLNGACEVQSTAILYRNRRLTSKSRLKQI